MNQHKATMRPAYAAVFVAESLDPETALTRHRDGWRRLAEQTEAATFFMWPEVFEAWWRELAEGVEARVIVVHQGDALKGVLPVMRATVQRGPAFVPRIDYAPYDRCFSPGGLRKFRVRQLSSVVSWRAMSLRPTLLCAKADQPEVILAVTNVMGATREVDEIVLPVRRGDEDLWLAGLRAAGLSPWVHDLQRSVITLDKVRSFDEVIAAQNHNFRKNIRRARTAAADAGLAYTFHVGRDQIAPHLETIAKLAAESWKGAGHPQGWTAIPYAEGQQRFIERLLSDSTSELTPVLNLGMAGDAPVIAMLFVRHGAAATGLLVFRGQLCSDASPGILGMGALVDWCAANGVSRFDLNATQDWIRHFSDASHMLVNVAAFRPTLRGRVYDVIARAWRKLRK